MTHKQTTLLHVACDVGTRPDNLYAIYSIVVIPWISSVRQSGAPTTICTLFDDHVRLYELRASAAGPLDFHRAAEGYHAGKQAGDHKVRHCLGMVVIFACVVIGCRRLYASGYRRSVCFWETCCGCMARSSELAVKNQHCGIARLIRSKSMPRGWCLFST